MERLLRLLSGMTVVLLLAVACTTGQEAAQEAPEPVDKSTPHEDMTLELWVGFTARELQAVKDTMEGFTEQYPWATVDVRGGVGDDQIIAAINGGKPPDVVLSFSLDNVGKFCTSGAWQDLTPYMEATEFDLGQFPESVLQYTSYGESQCALPFLTDARGLYYNNDYFEKAGLSEPPKTMSELTEYAKKLTEFNPDGSIKVAGFVPWFGYYQTALVGVGTNFGAEWYSEDGTESAIATDEDWAEMFQWQKDLVDWYGADKLQKFVAGQGDEWTAQNDFQKGRTAMAIDGEWRNAFIAADTPDLDYSTAPFPVADDMAEDYGFGSVGGTIIGLPKGSPHPDEAWLLLEYMASDTRALVFMSNQIRNVPTTFASLESPDLDVTPQFQTFLDVFANPLSHFKQTSAIGVADQNLLGDFSERWQAGKVADLEAGLQEVAEQVNTQLQQAAGP